MIHVEDQCRDAVRILGHRAQKLQETAEEIKAIFEEVNNNNR